MKIKKSEVCTEPCGTSYIHKNGECNNQKSIHTPTPWKVDTTKKVIWSPNEGYLTATIPDHVWDSEIGKADAEFIVRAVNCHEELVKACQRVADELQVRVSMDDPTSPAWLMRRVEVLRQALAKAEGKE